MKTRLALHDPHSTSVGNGSRIVENSLRACLRPCNASSYEAFGYGILSYGSPSGSPLSLSHRSGTNVTANLLCHLSSVTQFRWPSELLRSYKDTFKNVFPCDDVPWRTRKRRPFLRMQVSVQATCMQTRDTNGLSKTRQSGVYRSRCCADLLMLE